MRRPTLDLDAVARVEGGRWVAAKPFPDVLVQAIRDVADALGLEREPRDEKDWLNAGPSKLLALGLPRGFAARATIRQFGRLTIRVASRQDLISLKLWAATDTRRGQRREVDIFDLRELGPTADELRAAARWCVLKDGRPDFAVTDLAPVLATLGANLSKLLDE